jgi:hypothetical protein
MRQRLFLRDNVPLEKGKTERLIDQIGWPLLGLWLALRVLTSLWAALVSPLRPDSPVEQVIPLWPPSISFPLWLERTLLAPWQRWDVTYYLGIVQHGYRLDNGSAQFHPLFPWLAQALTWVTGQPLLALWLVSSLATLALLLAYERLARLDLSRRATRLSILIFVFFPPAFIFFAPYSESLFLLWAVLSFFWARKRRWWLAGLAGALATLTRQQGLFLILPLAWELWEAAERQPRQAITAWRDWLSLSLISLSFLLWIIYRAVALHDLQVDFSSLQALIYSVVISPSSSQVVPYQAFLWPWQALWLALAKLWRAFEISLAIDLALASVFLALLALAWKRMRLSYRIYAITITLVSFAYHTGPFYPYMGLPRHLLLAFPVFIGLGAVLRRRWQQLMIIGLGGLGIFFLLMLYVIRGWVP